MKAGIYKITNLVNGKVYIGQSINLTHRINEHKLKLLKNKHPNKHLQNAWNKYGEENFKFEIIEECSKNVLTIKEKYWIEYYGGYESNNNYNKKSAEEHVKYTEESKKKMSNSQKGLQAGEKNGMYGKHHSEETLNKIRQKMSEWYKTNNSPFKGRKHTEKSKDIMRQKRKGKRLKESTKQKIGANSKRMWERKKQDPEFLQKLKDLGLQRRKYSEDKKQEIYNVFKELKSRKATSKKLGIPLESCRLIINEMIEKEKNK